MGAGQVEGWVGGIGLGLRKALRSRPAQPLLLYRGPREACRGARSGQPMAIGQGPLTTTRTKGHCWMADPTSQQPSGMPAQWMHAFLVLAGWLAG